MISCTLKNAILQTDNDYRLIDGHNHQVHYIIKPHYVAQQINVESQKILATSQLDSSSTSRKDIQNQQQARTKQIQQLKRPFVKIAKDPSHEEERKVGRALNFLQNLGMKLKAIQSNSDESKLDVKTDNTSQNQTQEKPNIQKNIIDTTRHEPQYDDGLQIPKEQGQIIIPQKVSENRKRYLRKTSSFEKTLNIQFNKKQAKFETVNHLLESKNQWAFNYRSQDSNYNQISKNGSSLKAYQREGLKAIAQNLNELSNQLEFKNPIQDQKYSNKKKYLSQNTNNLQLKVRKCEIKKESLSDIQEIYTPSELPGPKDSNYRSNRTYRKSPQYQDESSECYFSDALSSYSRKGFQDSANIKISESSIKGIYQNIRKLTEDIMQSDDNSMNCHDSSSVSIEKISPQFSYEKKYIHGGDENFSSYSTNGRSPNKTYQMSRTFITQEHDMKYASNDSIYQQVYQPQQFNPKNNSSNDINVHLFNSGSNYINVQLPQKHKSGKIQIKHQKFLSQVGQISESNELIHQAIEKEHDDNKIAGGFDFDTKDSFLNEDQYSKFENENAYPSTNYFRKYTQDDSIKQPILNNISVRSDINCNYPRRR